MANFSKGELQSCSRQEYKVFPQGREWTRHAETAIILVVGQNILAEKAGDDKIYVEVATQGGGWKQHI